MGKNMKVFLVLSGKGGVGKSTISLGTALALAKNGTKVGACDCDLENPCLQQMTGVSPKDLRIGKLIYPFTWNGVELMGLSFLSEKFQREDMPVLIAETKKKSTINQMLDIVAWEAEVLIVDMPPGSGEEVRAFLPKNVAGCIIVTSPQRVSEKAVARTIKMCLHYKLPILGIVQNNLNNIGGDAGKVLAQKYNIPFVTRIPWDKEIVRSSEDQVPVDTKYFTKIGEVIDAEVKRTAGSGAGGGEQTA